MARWLSILGPLLLLAACSSSSEPASPPPPATETPDAGTPTEDADAAPLTPPDDACGRGADIPKSKCKPANPGSVIRGIVKFDPAHFAGKKNPVLRVFLHHQYILLERESKQGGHPHAFTSVDVDATKGEARFTLDLCLFGTAMWSEENCGFNLVAMLDEDGTNDADKLGSSAFLPQKGELVGMSPIDVSCHKPSPCVTIEAKCADGESCTTFTGLRKCACASSSCPSDDAICKL